MNDEYGYRPDLKPGRHVMWRQGPSDAWYPASIVKVSHEEDCIGRFTVVFVQPRDFKGLRTLSGPTLATCLEIIP